VVSGLMYAQVTDNAQLSALVAAMGANAQVLRIEAKAPTTSVPNWVTIPSGVSPENSGILGEQAPYEWLAQLPFKNVFQGLTDLGILTGYAGSTPWSQFLTNSTGPFRSNPVPQSYGSIDATQPTALAADRYKTQAGVAAMASGQYPLFLTELSNVNVQGYARGYTSTEYAGAVTSAAALLAQFKAVADTDPTNILVIVGDHGQNHALGSGGAAGVNIQVPLIIYQKNSAFTTTTFSSLTSSCSASNFPTARQDPYSMVDLAPTLAAMVGVAVPWQAEGQFIEDAIPFVNSSNLVLHFQDLFTQKRWQTCLYQYSVLWNDTSFNDCVNGWAFPSCFSAANASAAACECSRGIVQTRMSADNNRNSWLVQTWSGNFCVSMGYCFWFSLLAFCYLHMYSYCDLRAVFLKAGIDYVRASGGNPLDVPSREVGAYCNRKAFLLATLLQLFYWAGCCITFLVAYIIQADFFHSFDTTMWSTLGLLAAWFGICIITGMLFAFFVQWLYKWKLWFKPSPHSTYFKAAPEDERAFPTMVHDLYKLDHPKGMLTEYDTPAPKKVGFLRRLLDCLLLQEPDITPTVYLVKYYWAWWTILLMTILVWSCCLFCAIIPMGLSDPTITRGNLNWRVRLMSLLLLGLPAVLFSINDMLRWVKFSPWNARWDRVFRLKVVGDCRRIDARLRKIGVARPPAPGGAAAAAHLNAMAPGLGQAWNTMAYPVGQIPVPPRLLFNFAHASTLDPPRIAPYYPEASPTLHVPPGIVPLDTLTGAPLPNRTQLADKQDFYDIHGYQDNAALRALFGDEE